jgi:hypothetical protein
VRDVTATGCIEVSRQFSTIRGYAKAAAEAAAIEVQRVLRGRPAQPLLVTSLPTYVVVHEFGHLAEAALAERGLGYLEPAFAELSRVVLANPNPSTDQWRYHLVNYPELPGSLPGPARGGKNRQRANREALCSHIGGLLGRYASTNRDELFAEAFSLAFVGPPELRATLAPFLAVVRANITR